MIESKELATAPPPPDSVPLSHVTEPFIGDAGNTIWAPAGGPPAPVHDAPEVVVQFDPTDQSLPEAPDPPVQVQVVVGAFRIVEKGIVHTPRPCVAAIKVPLGVRRRSTVCTLGSPEPRRVQLVLDPLSELAQ